LRFSDQLRKIADQMDAAERRGDHEKFVQLLAVLQTMIGDATAQIGKAAIRGGVNGLLDQLFKKAGI